jgi:hypothetical protein
MDAQTIEMIARAVVDMAPAIMSTAAPIAVPTWDQTISQFVGNNWLTLTAAYMMLKGVAKVTPWAWDDSVVALFAGIIPMFRPGYVSKAEREAEEKAAAMVASSDPMGISPGATR